MEKVSELTWRSFWGTLEAVSEKGKWRNSVYVTPEQGEKIDEMLKDDISTLLVYTAKLLGELKDER